MQFRSNMPQAKVNKGGGGSELSTAQGQSETKNEKDKGEKTSNGNELNTFSFRLPTKKLTRCPFIRHCTSCTLSLYMNTLFSCTYLIHMPSTHSAWASPRNGDEEP